MIDGYPEESELSKIEMWDVRDIDDLIKYIRERWMYADAGYFYLAGKNVLRLELHTAGWSGNESIIDSLQKNFIFWSMFWKKSTVGGHYYFVIKRRLLCKEPSKS